MTFAPDQDQFALRGRAAPSNESGRFEAKRRSIFDDGWGTAEERSTHKATTVHRERAKAIITRNQSPDVPFEQSVNAYRGCEHGCIYCFARPSHTYMGLSAGQDFETEIFAKPNAAELLEGEITRPGYQPRTIAMGTNTDPYQPIEKTQRITRALLEVLLKHRHPVSLTTKSHMVTRDADLLGELATHGLVSVHMSVTTLNTRLARAMEPRASSPARRLDAMRVLSDAGIPVGVMVAPVIPGLTDHEMEWILAAAKDAGARSAAWVMLRLPGEVAPLFEQWLGVHAPDRKKRVLQALRDMRGGKLNDPRFGARMRGSGPWAEIIGQRFLKSARRNTLSAGKPNEAVQPPPRAQQILAGFDAPAQSNAKQRKAHVQKQSRERSNETQLSLF